MTRTATVRDLAAHAVSVLVLASLWGKYVVDIAVRGWGHVAGGVLGDGEGWVGGIGIGGDGGGRGTYVSLPLGCGRGIVG
jgi:hypothetical protein